MQRISLALGAALLLTACGEQTDTGRWYDSAQVSAGKAIFQANCASCHGSRAEATPDWKKPLDNGKYPPPPLNGSAHAWHHSMSVLLRTIDRGGAALGGWMPGFDGKLNDADKRAVIAYFQSFWSDEIYTGWEQRGGVDR